VTDVSGVEREFDTEIAERHLEERIAWQSVGGETKHDGVGTFHRRRRHDMIQIDW
jgi:hypothetical protein